MKPWFVKEADIIKFPEPEKKVIELPNVQSYPDFLTGVKDLYMRKEKGEISQDSHDKLYADLIQRFMRKESFETPWFVREQKGQCNRGHAMELHIAIAIYMRLQSKNDIDINSLKNKYEFFKIKPGEIWIVNNYTVLHGRKKFKDLNEKRLLLRAWVSPKKFIYKGKNILDAYNDR